MLTPGQVSAALGLDTPDGAALLGELTEVRPGPRPPALASGPAGRALLRRLHVTDTDAAEMLAAAPDAHGCPELWWLFERLHARTLADIGRTDPAPRQWPWLPGELDAVGRWLYAHVFAAVAPDVHAWHTGRGVAPEVSWASLRELGRQVERFREFHGMGGLSGPAWVELPYRGALYELGRLQYSPITLGAGPGGPQHWYDEAAAAARGVGFRYGDPALDVHIPPAGPLSDAAVGASLRQARTFFDRQFPQPVRRVAVCSSWLLDDQLADYLPAASNVVRFQRRFTLVDGDSDGDLDVLMFVFRRLWVADWAELPQRTTLERAAVAHVRAGHHWRVRTGWVDLDLD